MADRSELVGFITCLLYSMSVNLNRVNLMKMRVSAVMKLGFTQRKLMINDHRGANSSNLSRFNDF